MCLQRILITLPTTNKPELEAVQYLTGLPAESNILIVHIIFVGLGDFKPH